MAWCSTFPTHLHKLASIQNKAVKLISRGQFSESTTQILLKILKLPDLFKFGTAQPVHNYINSKFPLFLFDYFNIYYDVSKRSTRISTNSYNLHKPLYRTNRMQNKTIKY